MDGVIVIRKEKGFTSHDVVAKLRGRSAPGGSGKSNPSGGYDHR